MSQLCSIEDNGGRHHCPITQYCTWTTESIWKDVQRRGCISFQIPERAQCRVAIDLQWVMRIIVKEYGQSVWDDDGLKSNDSWSPILNEVPS